MPIPDNKKVKYQDDKKVKMSREYLIDGKWTDTLTMREPTFQDQLNVADTEEALQNPTMFANLCDITVEDMQPFAGKDMAKVVKTYESFFV
jgi:hypothetical protein